jgi:DNA-binding MarR family transcriptional regulator
MPSKKQPRKPAGSPLPHTGLLGRELSDAVVFFHEAVASRLGIGSAEWKCLGLLQHGPLTSSRLAELSGFTTGAITGVVDRLEQSGHVRRDPHPTDRRSVIIQPLHVAKLQRRVRPIFKSLQQSMAGITGRYTAGQLELISAFLRDTTEALHRETVKLRQLKQTTRKG